MWITQINYKTIHIIPLEDIKSHIGKGMYCHCKPRLKIDMVIHNAYDAREFDEVEVHSALIQFKGRFTLPEGRGDN